MIAALFAAAACAPAAPPSPTAAPAKPAATAAPAKAETKPAEKAAPAKAETKPAEKAAEKPAAKAETKTETKPAAKAETKPAAKAEAKPAAKVDTKAIEDFYRGKTVRIIVGSAPGGGYDTYARAISRHMGRHIPGNPNMIVENMPGAGSLKAANHVYNVAEKDGTIIGHIQGGLFLQQLLGLEGVEFDARKWQVLGVPARDDNTCVATGKSGLKSLADTQNPGGKQFIVGGNAPGSATWDVPMRLKAALDLNLKVVEGYDGTAKVRLAMDQGEVDGMCGWGWESLRATGLDRVQAGDWVVLTQVTEEPIQHPVMQNVPLASNLAKDDEAKQLIRLGIMVPSQILRPFVVTPDVSRERAVALREAFAKTMEDPQFRQDAEKTKLTLEPMPGERAEQLISDLFDMPENVKAKLKAINEKKI